MSAALAAAHITAQERIRTRTAAAVARAWRQTGTYDRVDVERFVRLAVPIAAAGQRQSALTTNAFLSKALGGRPLHLKVADVTGAAVRNGVQPSEVYARPFVTVWTALKDGRNYAEAVAAGGARASASAALDVQLTMRATLVDVGERDDRIVGYQRIPDGGACDFCQLVAGQRYTTDQLMPVHNHCGCGVDVITSANRGSFTGKPENDLSVTRDGVTAAVAEHGELGPLLVNGDDHFTAL